MKINKRNLAADICLATAVLIVALLLLAIPERNGSFAEVLQSGESVGKYSLATDRTVELKDANGKLLNIVKIENGRVYVSRASCSGGDCVKHPAIYKEGQCIACLPNGVTVVIRGGGSIDGVVG